MTRTAFRSKAHWGYDAAFTAACTAELTVTSAQIASDACLVACLGDRIAGFGDLNREAEGWMIDNLWIDPDFIGQGIGRQLLSALREEAGQLGAKILYVVSDPTPKVSTAAKVRTTSAKSNPALTPGGCFRCWGLRFKPTPYHRAACAHQTAAVNNATAPA
jgi:GNAT superfamily N-acetyltransferase